MGSIADLLGDQLRVGLAELARSDELQTDEAAPASSVPASAVGEVDHVQRAREIAMEALLEESGLEASAARAELRLKEDLDLDELSLYATVAQVEREAKLQLDDAIVDVWETLGNLLDGVEAAARKE